MRKYRKLLLVLLCLAALAAIVVLVIPDNEPRYQGHRLSYWLDRYAEEISKLRLRPADTEAGRAILHIGTNGLPFLLSCIRYEPKPLTLKARGLLLKAPQSLLARFPIRWLREDPVRQSASRAFYGFEVLGPQARPAIPELARIMKDPAATNAWRRAALALAHIGTEELPLFITRLQNTNSTDRALMAICMVWMPGFAESGTNAYPALVQCVQDRDPVLREQAATALTWLKLPPELAVSAFTNCLSVPGAPGPRRVALYALGRMGPAARSAEPLLHAALQDPDPQVRQEATNALRQITPETLTNAPPH